MHLFICVFIACLPQQALKVIGGPSALAQLLDSDVSTGLPADDNLKLRATEFGHNWMPVPDPKTWIQLFIDSFDDTTLIILIVSAIVSLAVRVFIKCVSEGSNETMMNLISSIKSSDHEDVSIFQVRAPFFAECFVLIAGFSDRL